MASRTSTISETRTCGTGSPTVRILHLCNRISSLTLTGSLAHSLIQVELHPPSPAGLFKIDKWFGFYLLFHIKLREFRKMNYNPKPGDSKLVAHRSKIADEHRLVVGINQNRAGRSTGAFEFFNPSSTATMRYSGPAIWSRPWAIMSRRSRSTGWPMKSPGQRWRWESWDCAARLLVYC